MVYALPNMRRQLHPCFALTALFLTGTLFLTGCGNDNKTLHVAVIGDAQSPFEAGPFLSPSGQLVRAASAEGLVSFDEQGHVIPAIADRWIISDDGLSYIFRLRSGLWRDGNPITGEMAKTALQNSLASLRGTALALDLADISDIRSMAGRVLEIRLNRPMPDLLQLLAQPELGLLYRNKGAGPFTLKRSGQTAILAPISPEKRGLPTPDSSDNAIRNIQLTAVSGKTAISQFANAKTNIILGGTASDWPRTSRIALGKNKPRLDPVTGLFGLTLTNTRGLLANPANREAIAMALDRNAFAAALSAPSYLATTRITPPGISDDTGQVDERWASISIGERQQSAATTIARWRKTNPQSSRLSIALPKGPGADLLFDRLKTDLAQISIKLTRTPANAPADMRLIDTVARYDRVIWFLNQFNCAITHGPCSEAADRFVSRAKLTEDPHKSAEYLAQAEATMLQANLYIPLGTPVRWSLVGAKINTFSVNRWAVHPLPTLAISRK